MSRWDFSHTWQVENLKFLSVMIAKILVKGTAAAIVGYVMREFHDKEQYTADTWRVIDSDGILGNDYRRIVDSFDIEPQQENQQAHRTYRREFRQGRFTPSHR